VGLRKYPEKTANNKIEAIGNSRCGWKIDGLTKNIAKDIVASYKLLSYVKKK